MRRGLALVTLLVATIALVVPSRASAEWFAGLYLGVAVTNNADVDFEAVRQSRLTPATFDSVDLDTAPVWGGRGGYWFGKNDLLAGFGPYLGVALDLSYFRPRIAAQTVSTDVGTRRFQRLDIQNVLLTPEAIVRYPLLKSDDFPDGRLEPYAGVGPTLFFSSAEDGGGFSRSGTSESDTGVGVVFGPGLSWLIAEHVAVFAEYRFVHISPTFDFTAGSVTVPINSHQFNVGVSYRF